MDADPQPCLGQGDGGAQTGAEQRQRARQHTWSTQAQPYDA